MSQIHASCFPCPRYGIVACPCVDHKIDRDPPHFKVMSNQHKHPLLGLLPSQRSQHVSLWALRGILRSTWLPTLDCATLGSAGVTSWAGLMFNAECRLVLNLPWMAQPSMQRADFLDDMEASKLDTYASLYVLAHEDPWPFSKPLHQAALIPTAHLVYVTKRSKWEGMRVFGKTL